MSDLNFSAVLVRPKMACIKDDDENVIFSVTLEADIEVASGNEELGKATAFLDQMCETVTIVPQAGESIDQTFTLRMAELVSLGATANDKAGLTMKWEIAEQVGLDEFKDRLADFLPLRKHPVTVTAKLHKPQAELPL